MGKKATVKLDLTTGQVRTLNSVVTLAEACVLSGKSRAAVINAVNTGKVYGRRSFTGGNWIVDLSSLLKHYPEAKERVWFVK